MSLDEKKAKMVEWFNSKVCDSCLNMLTDFCFTPSLSSYQLCSTISQKIAPITIPLGLQTKTIKSNIKLYKFTIGQSFEEYLFRNNSG